MVFEIRKSVYASVSQRECEDKERKNVSKAINFKFSMKSREKLDISN